MLLLHANGDALASSITTLSTTAPGLTSSLILLGTAEAYPIDARPALSEAARGGATPSIYVISPSVVAYGAEAIPTAREAVASIDEKETTPNWRHEAAPLVIRGGVVGDAFAPATAATPQELEAAAPSPATREPDRPQPESTPVAPAAASPATPAALTRLPE